ncbi:IPExxxVDY family protein [Leeuwenhoekiella sp. H156]|uniref:IPExxxVDY family protein n=1 Tax=Leeuwenhoekiella sp. H156 TaxID=3450128 RepID=UPI003FA42F64
MGSYKLLLDEAFDFDFNLIAIHCSLEQYRLAFLINKYAGLRLSSSEDVHFYAKQLKYSFGTMRYEDSKNYLNYTLISNHFKLRYSQVLTANALFAESEHFKTFNLVPEVKNADYLLKVESDEDNAPCTKLLGQLNRIPHIISAYQIDVSALKSKQNLIFE